MNNLLAGGTTYKITNPVIGSTLLDILANDGPTEFLKVLLPKFIGLVFVVGALIFFFILIIGAIQWISSGGDKNAVEAAKGKVSNAVIGIVILFSVYAIIMIIESFFGVSILTLDIESLVIQ